jgi:DNA polymerase elongation subunit (family B)
MKPIEFQIVSWFANDVEFNCSDSDSDTDSGFNKNEHRKYVIKLFGRTAEGKSIGVSVVDFTPHFYVKLKGKSGVSRSEVNKLVDKVYAKLGRHQQGCIIDARVLHKKDFWGFTNNQMFPFIRFCFASERSLRAVLKVLKTNQALWNIKLYESNILPFLRFAHIRNILPVGWVQIRNYEKCGVMQSKCKLDYQVFWKDIDGLERPDIAPIKIASFDIECMSSDGDFPVPQKDYVKVANDIYNMVKNDEPDWKTTMVNTVLTKFKTKALVPFETLEHHDFEKIEDVLLQHSNHIALIAKADKSIVNIEIRNVFAKAGIPNSFGPFLAFLDKINTTSFVRNVVQSWLTKAFAGKPDAEVSIATVVSLYMREKDSIVHVLTKYLNDILPRVKGDEIIQIGVTVHNYGETECSYKTIINLGTCDPLDNIDVICCKTERELLQKWVDVTNEIDPDIVCGYNIFGFDYNFLYERAVELECVDVLEHSGRLRYTNASYKEAKLSSSALGDNIMKYIDMPGRTSIDVMKVVQRDHKLDSYKLDNVASHFMKMNKKDVSPADIFRLFLGSSTDRAKVADYCIQDCSLCNHLMMKLEIMANNIGMANVCSVPLGFIFMRGQGVKIFSLVAKQCKELGFLIPTVEVKEVDENEEGYEGAIVLEPKVGIYIDEPIAVFDYASLYPSSMISENLSHDCIIIDKAYDNLPDIEYIDVSYDLYEGKGDEKVKIGEKVCRYAQNQKGVIPHILMHLLKQRKQTRKKIELKRLVRDSVEHTGYITDNVFTSAEANQEIEIDCNDIIEDVYTPFQKACLDGLQLAYKITANSLYGQVGSRTSPIYLKDIAACTTATGRKMIMMAKDFIESKQVGFKYPYEPEVVYGDSVTAYTPCILKIDGIIHVDKIEDLAQRYGGKWRNCKDIGREAKEACELKGVQVWTSYGWTALERVIRHKLAPHKKILRVVTRTGVVDVTDEHSLLDETHAKVDAKDVKVGDKLLHNDTPKHDHLTSVTHSQARHMGFIMGDGTVPASVLNGSKDVKRAFWEGLCSANGGATTFDTHSQISAATLYILASSLGYHVSTDDTLNVYRLTVTIEATSLQNANEIVAIQEIPKYSGYVYDLTTSNHEFAAGVGRLICSNTDSILLRFHMKDENGAHIKGKESIPIVRDLSVKISKEFKHKIKQPHDLEWEKIFYPFILFSKKRYCANKYEWDDHKYKQTSMGIVLKRRDNAQIVKTVYGGILDIILNEQDIPKSIRFMKKTLEDLIDGKFPMEQLVLSKTLKAHYKDPTRIAHKVLADRIKERNPGNAPQINDRIPYVYYMTEKTGKVLQGDKIEDPDYIRENNLRPDYEFYISNQIMNPVLQVYALAPEQIKGYKLDTKHWRKKELELVEQGKTDKFVMEKIRDLKEKEVQRLLFEPIIKKLSQNPELIKLKNKRNGNRTITEWFGV